MAKKIIHELLQHAEKTVLSELIVEIAEHYVAAKRMIVEYLKEKMVLHCKEPWLFHTCVIKVEIDKRNPYFSGREFSSRQYFSNQG